MSNYEKTFTEHMYRWKKIAEFGLNALERSKFFPLILKQSLQPIPEEVRLAYEQCKPRISHIYGEDHLRDDYLYHGTGRYHYQPEGNHKYEPHINGKTVDVLRTVVFSGLQPQIDVWVPTPANNPTVSLTHQRFYSRWYADRHNHDKLLWSYGNSADWAFLFTVNSISNLLEIPYIFSLIKRQSSKQQGLLGSAQNWISDVRDDIKIRTSYLDVWRSNSTIINNFGVMIVLKKSDIQTYDFPLLKKSEKRTLFSIPSNKFIAIEVPLRRVNEVKSLLKEMGHPDIEVLPTECVDLHMSKFPLAELTKMEENHKIKKLSFKKMEICQLDFYPITHSKLKQIASDSDTNSYSPYELLSVLDESPLLRSLLSQKSSWEGFTVRYHTLSGLMLLKKYFSNQEMLPGGVKKDFFRIFFSLHDIGDSLGSTTKSKLIYNQAICVEFLSRLGFSQEEISLAKTLLSDDPIGSYLKKAGLLVEGLSHLPQMIQFLLINLSKREFTKLTTEAVMKIKKMADTAEINYQDFLQLIIIFHMIDAGTYTSEGGTSGSLNYVFSFDKKTKTMSYSPHIISLIKALNVLLN